MWHLGKNLHKISCLYFIHQKISMTLIFWMNLQVQPPTYLVRPHHAGYSCHNLPRPVEYPVYSRCFVVAFPCQFHLLVYTLEHCCLYIFQPQFNQALYRKCISGMYLIWKMLTFALFGSIFRISATSSCSADIIAEIVRFSSNVNMSIYGKALGSERC